MILDRGADNVAPMVASELRTVLEALGSVGSANHCWQTRTIGGANHGRR